MFGSVRARVTVIAVVTTFAALAVAAFVAQGLLASSLYDEVDTTIQNRAFDVADGIDIDDVISNTEFPTDPETFVGVIEDPYTDEPLLEVHNDLDPSVEDFTRHLSDNPNEVDDEDFGMPQTVSLPSLELLEGNDKVRLAMTPVSSGTELVVVARSLASIDGTIGDVRAFSVFAVPLLSLLVGLLTWVLVGRAMRPVEDMRREVEAIRATDLRRRVGAEGQPTEISRLGNTMNSMLSRLEDAQVKQRQFASDAAHELRSPLASMAAQLDVDVAHPDTADHEQTTSNLRAETARLQGLVEDLLLLARSEGSDPAGYRLLDLDDLVATAVAGVVPPTHVGIALPSPSTAQVRGEATHLERLITNLVSNAVRHAESAVQISIAQVGSAVELRVEDDGAGIAEADRERIFERFVRLDEARSRDGGGSGLGLALAHEIVEQHGGNIVVESSGLGGARFVVSLPAA